MLTRSNRLPTAHRNVKSIFHYTSDNEVVIEKEHDVTSIIEANKFRQSVQSFRFEGEQFNHVAQVDYLAIKTWCETRGIVDRWWAVFNGDDGELLREFCNDPDNKAWRSRLGKI